MLSIKTDMLVIGGGINGSGVAVDAAGRGLNVVLCEANDLASATSSASTKLVHGGLRYLEQYEFKLVRESLKEREVLLNKASHIIQPLRFVLPHEKHLRPICIIRIGLFLYDFLAGKMRLKKSRKITLTSTSIEGKPLKEKFKKGFTYSDCRIDDSRMVVLNAIQAEELGAKILTHTKLISAKRVGDRWEAILINDKSQKLIVNTSIIINAAGPWVADLIKNKLETKTISNVRLIKGSHIVIPKLYDGDHAYILQNKDNRIIFAIPYGFTGFNDNEFTCIGTTDVSYNGDPANVKISNDEIQYLCNSINNYFEKEITAEDIIWEWSGVRPLYDDDSDDPAKNTREYHLEKEDSNGKGLLLSIFGGKITTFRKLSEKVLEEVEKYHPFTKSAWTAKTQSPGSDPNGLNHIFHDLKQDYSWVDNKLLFRWASTYGLRTRSILKGVFSYEDLGINFGYNLYEKEVIYLINREWARELDDILFRRTKVGLWLKKNEKLHLSEWLAVYTRKNDI